MVLVNTMCSIYYNMVIAYGLYYLFSSFAAEVPWGACRPEWKARYCCVDRALSSAAGPRANASDEANGTDGNALLFRDTQLSYFFLK